MLALILFLASSPPVPVSVPDSGMTALLVGSGVLAVGVIGRVFKNRKK